jgi:hypothetical protein
MTLIEQTNDERYRRVLGFLLAAVFPVGAFLAIQLIMLANGFAPIVFISSVVSVLLAPVFGYRFANTAVRLPLLNTTLWMTLAAVCMGGIVSGAITWAWLAATGQTGDLGIPVLLPLWGVLMTLVGLVSIGPFAALAVAPLVLLWAVALRRLSPTAHR